MELGNGQRLGEFGAQAGESPHCHEQTIKISPGEDSDGEKGSWREPPSSQRTPFLMVVGRVWSPADVRTCLESRVETVVERRGQRMCWVECASWYLVEGACT